MEEKMEIETTVYVRKFNRSLYLLVPHETAKELGILEHTRARLFKSKQDRSLIYKFPVTAPAPEPPADIQEPPV